MDSREFDVRFLNNLALPFDAQTKELAEGNRIVSGANMYVTAGGKLAQAPGLNDTDLTGYTITGRVDRVISYETVEAVPHVYLLASVYDGSSWSVKYINLDDVSPAWTSIGSLRDVDASIYPHEFVVAGGKVYIRFSASGQEAGVVFDGKGGSISVTGWGIVKPPFAPSATGLFGVSTVTTLFGWSYAYAYVNNTKEHVSSRSGDSARLSPTNNVPRIQGVYSTDTTVTHIDIYRTSDGGGTFYKLDRIANNTAGGNFTYNDNQSALVAGNPKDDSELNTRDLAPSEVSNEPVPRTADGSAATFPDQSTGMAYFARRIWFGIGNRLFFTGQEEINNGVPEESFPDPFGVNGDFYVLQGRIQQTKAARRALYINTSAGTLILAGQDLTNFLLDTHVPDIAGAYIQHPGDGIHACAAFRDSFFFLSADYQIYQVNGADEPQVISLPLGTQLADIIIAALGGNRIRVEFEVYSRDGLNWLVVNVADNTDSTVNRQFVYDLNQKIWFTPWSKKIQTMTFGRTTASSSRELIVFTYDGTTSKLAILDRDHLSDLGTNFTPSATISLTSIPAGNHINELRKWALSPILSYFILERTKFGGDTDPTVTYRLDEFSGSATTATGYDPPYLAQHSSYYEKWYPVQVVCKRAQLIITGTGGQQLELQNIGFVFQPEAGA